MARSKKRRTGRKGLAVQPRAMVSLSEMPKYGDFGAQGPANQDGLIEEPRGHKNAEGKTVNPNSMYGKRRKVWITTYLDQGKLTKKQHIVADMLYRASVGKLSDDPLAALRIDKLPAPSDPAGAAFDARRHFHRMWEHVPGYARPVIERVVLEDRPVWASSGPQQARHIDRLARGLEALAEAMG